MPAQLENEKPAPVAQTGNGLELVSRAADAQENAPPPWPWQAIGEFNDRALRNLIGEASLWHFTDGARRYGLREKVEEACPPSVLADALTSLAPVRFNVGGTFDLDDTVESYSLVVPCRDETGDLIDVAAFDLRQPYGVATYLKRAFAVGLDAIFDARLVGGFRVHVHACAWGFLKSECCGLLPIDWRATALHMMHRRVGGLIVDTVQDGRSVNLRMSKALRVPEIYVREAT